MGRIPASLTAMAGPVPAIRALPAEARMAGTGHATTLQLTALFPDTTW
jgi:hypothetical protein